MMTEPDGTGATIAGQTNERRLEDASTLRQLISNIAEGIYITRPEGQILDANPALLDLVGIKTLDELRRCNVRDLCADAARWEEENEVLERDGAVRDFELDIRRRDGSIRTVLDTCYLVRDPGTRAPLRYGIFVDITARKALERRLRGLLIRDPLTGCYNRRYLEDLRARLNTSDGAFGAIVVDVDNFKLYNDHFGHHAGDEVLIRLARFLMRQVRAEDAVIRMGGDEFLVVLLGDSVESTVEIVERFTETASADAPVPISLGWAERNGGEPIEKTVARADQALIHVRLQERDQQRRGRAGDKLDPA